MRRIAGFICVIFILNAIISRAEITNQILVKLNPHVSVEEVTATHPGVRFERASSLPRIFLFSVENIKDVNEEMQKFVSDKRIAWADNNEVPEYQPAGLPTDPSFANGAQWFHAIINSSHAWQKGLSGQDQIVQVIDTAVFPQEKDLRNQLDFARSFEGNVNEPPSNAGPHGTICTNIITAEANNDFCGVGVAFSARAAVFPFISNPRPFYNSDFAEAQAQGFSVSSNSYGPSVCNPSWGCLLHERGMTDVLKEALELAQNQNNTVFVYAAGNEGRFEGSPNYMEWGSTPRILVVGATSMNGTRASYSNFGAAVWMVAPAGETARNTTWTSFIGNGEQQCGEVGGGTSYAAPMVSGAAAILRSAYPSLTWRDVKLILAYSADKTDINHSSWIKNGAGRWFSNHYGFGQLNVGNAVELASTWKSVGPLQIRTFHSTIKVPIVLSEDVPVITSAISVPYGIVSRVESVQLTLNMMAWRRGELQVELLSPSNTTCVIFPFRADVFRHYRDYLTSANCFLGEDPTGQWTLRVARRPWAIGWIGQDELISFAVTIWGETAPSQVQLLAPSTVPRLSSFTIKEGDTFQQLTLFNNYPATIGLFWKDTFGLYGELFTRSGLQTTGTQRLNPSNSDHPTVSVFSGGDHVLTYLTNDTGSMLMQAEVRDIDFIPLTPLTTLPFTDFDPKFISVAVVEDNIIVCYRSAASRYTRLALLSVNFGSRDTTPLCVPSSNYTTEADEAVFADNNCTEIIYRRDGKIELVKQTELMTQAPVTLQGIGMNLVLGTWSDGQSITTTLIRSDLEMIVSSLQAPPTSKVRAAATPEDVFIAFGHQQGVLVERYDMDMNLHESFAFSSNEPVVAVDIAYTHVEGLSLIVATSHNISLTTFLRSYDRSFVQTNQATIASMLSLNVPVLDIDQSVMSNGDLAVTFSTIQEIHVQLFDSTIFGSLSSVQPTAFPDAVHSPQTTAPYEVPVQTSPLETSDLQLPSWAIVLVVVSSVLAVLVATIVIVANQKMKRNQRRAMVAQIGQDPDLIAYTKMTMLMF